MYRYGLLCLALVTVTAAQVQEPPYRAGDYPSSTYLLTSRVLQKGAVKVVGRQVKPKTSTHPFYCRAWVEISGPHEESIAFPDIDPVGAHYGLLMPAAQTIPGYLYVLKYGSYDGRLILINESGKPFDIPGGSFFIDNNARRLYSVYASDQPELYVFDLKLQKVIFHSEIDRPAAWYRNTKDYLFVDEDEWTTVRKGGKLKVHVVEPSEGVIRTEQITEAELQKLTKIELIAKRGKGFKDCAF